MIANSLTIYNIVVMQAAILIRCSSKLLFLIMGSMAVFCLYYVGQLRDYNTVWYLLIKTFGFDGGATAIVYFQRKYLDR